MSPVAGSGKVPVAESKLFTMDDLMEAFKSGFYASDAQDGWKQEFVDFIDRRFHLECDQCS